MEIIQNNYSNSMSKFFSKVYLWMFIGLALSGLTAYYSYSNSSVMNIIANYYLILILLEFGVVIAFSALRNKISPTVAKILFVVYSVLNGVTLSSIFIVYKLGSIATVFLVSALMFALMGIYGYVTKQDLSSLGKILIFGLLAIIIMSFINIFIKSSSFSLGLSIISVVLFLGLTAYDMQMLKGMYEYYSSDESELEKSAIFGALSLYLDFINIFLELLRIFGKSKD